MYKTFTSRHVSALVLSLAVLAGTAACSVPDLAGGIPNHTMQGDQTNNIPANLPKTELPVQPGADKDLYDSGFYLNHDSQAMHALTKAEFGSEMEAVLEKISYTPAAVWVGDWNPVESVQQTVSHHAQEATQQGKTATFVLYAIPGRDCGNYSAGGYDATTYTKWIAEIASGLNGSNSSVILEPDALALMGKCGQDERYKLIADAVQALNTAGVVVYIDASHSNWVPAMEMAGMLMKAGIENARGFALNVSNFNPTFSEQTYADEINENLLNRFGLEKYYVIDTSRNGNGSNGEWCNPVGAKTGAEPVAGTAMLDALLWVKTPGESDGNCNNGPNAGVWSNEIAYSLMK